MGGANTIVEYSVSEMQNLLQQFYFHKQPARKNISISNVIDKSGWECSVFSFTLNFVEDNIQRQENLLLKLYLDVRGAYKAIGEFYGMQQLAFAGYPVPTVLFLVLENSPFNGPFIIMEKVSGPLLLQALKLASPDQRRELIQLFCQLFVELHTMDWYPFAIDPTHYQPQDFIPHMLSEQRALIITHHKNSLFAPVLDWLDKRGQMVTCENLSVIHWDYHPGNIILGEDGIPCVIDWTQIEISDYRFDLAWTLLLVSTFGRPELREEVLREYEDCRGHPVPHLDFFEVAICLKRLLSMSIYQDCKVERAEQHLHMHEQQMISVQSALTLLQSKTGIVLPDFLL